MMTRKETSKTYGISSIGIIETPGKFEGRMLYVPHFWELFLNGCHDEEIGDVLIFYITSEDRKEFPELGNRRKVVRLYQRCDGFIIEI